MTGTLVTAMLLAMIHARASAHCDEGWVEYGGSCFLFQTHHCAFAEAENHCLQHSGHLTSVHGSDEANFLISEIQMVYRRLPKIEDDSFWIGHKGHDRWTDGTKMDFSGWNKNATTSNMGRSKFISIGWHWYMETDPTVPHYYICRRRQGSSRPKYCPKSSVHNHRDGHCYGFVDKNVTWEEAEMACSNLTTSNTSGYLVTVDKRNRHIWVNYRDMSENGKRRRRDCTQETYLPQQIMRNNVNNGRHRFCPVADILSNTWTPNNCYDTNYVLCEFEQGKRKTSVSVRGRPCLETSSSSTFSTRFIIGLSSLSTHDVISRSRYRDVRTSEPQLPNKRRKRSQSTGTREHVTGDNSMKSKREINTSQKNKSIDFNRLSTNKFRTGHEESETLLHSLNGVLSNLSDNATNIHLTDSIETKNYENNATTTSPATPNMAHVVIGILGIIIFVILICGLFMNDLKSMMLHIVRDENGRANRENNSLYHPHLTVHANYQNGQSSTQTLSESRERLSFKA